MAIAEKGNPTGKPSSLIHYPELFWSWVDKAIDRQFKPLLNDEEREELHEIHRYWRGKSLHGMERDLLPESHGCNKGPECKWPPCLLQ